MMRSFPLKTFLLLALALAVIPAVSNGQNARAIALHSSIMQPKVVLPEGNVVVFSITGKVNDKGEGACTLTLDPNTRSFDEFGEVTSVTAIAERNLNCTLKFVKMGRVAIGPGRDEERPLYAIVGPQITSKLFLLATKDFRAARLLIQDKEGRVVNVIAMTPPDVQPCHPGCFPAGTLVQTPSGERRIETIRAGEQVTIVRPDGTSAAGKVQSVFVTHNRLLKVATDDGVLLTTLTQPLCLESGEIRAAGELQAGDRIYRWQSGGRRAVTVRGVSLTDRHEQVFNLVLGDCEVFVAAGYLARSKPPAEAILTSSPAPRFDATLPARR